MLPEIVEELQKLNPKNQSGYRENCHHQHFSDIGNIDLERHISATTALMKCCQDWREFKELLNKVYPVRSSKDIFLRNEK